VAAELLGIGASKLDELIAAGHVRAKKSGKVLLVLVASLEQYAESLPDAFLQPPAHIRRKLEAIEAKLPPEAAAAPPSARPTTRKPRLHGPAT
jgi:excisionase family DNA binding protein